MTIPRNALFRIGSYSAVIPHVQNVYGPERVETGWQWGFKYVGGVFEFFTCSTRVKAAKDHARLVAAIDSYYTRSEK